MTQRGRFTLRHWWLGNDIIQKQKEQGWGTKVIEQLSVDLQNRYGSDSGYSARNLGYMKSFAAEYPDFPFLQVPLAKFREMPFLQARLGRKGVVSLCVNNCWQKGCNAITFLPTFSIP